MFAPSVTLAGNRQTAARLRLVERPVEQADGRTAHFGGDFWPTSSASLKSLVSTSLTRSTKRCRPQLAAGTCDVRGPSARRTSVKAKLSASSVSMALCERL